MIGTASKLGGASAAGLNALGVQFTLMTAEAATDKLLDYMIPRPPESPVAEAPVPEMPRKRTGFTKRVGGLLWTYTLPTIAYAAVRSGIGAVSSSVVIGAYGTAAVAGIAKSVGKHL